MVACLVSQPNANLVNRPYLVKMQQIFSCKLNRWLVVISYLYLFMYGTIQVLRHHVFDFFMPTHILDDLQYCKSLPFSDPTHPPL